MSESAELERRYRRLVGVYPGSVRREHGRELLSVLLDCAAHGQRRPDLGESLDLCRSALWLRLRPGAPRSAATVFAAVRLMYVGAALELCTLATVALTADNIRAAIVERHPQFRAAQWQSVVHGQLLPIEIGAGIAAWLLVWLAWANGRGHNSGRIAFAALFAIETVSLLSGIAHGSATYAPDSLVAGAAIWLVALATMLLIFHPRSGSHYAPKPHRLSGAIA
jgi:hypothetical protein